MSRDLWEGNPASVIPEAIKLLKEAGYNLVGAEACLGLKSVYYQEEYEGLEKKLFPEAKPAWTDKDISCEEHLKG